jgi:hypothetical protein
MGQVQGAVQKKVAGVVNQAQGAVNQAQEAFHQGLTGAVNQAQQKVAGVVNQAQGAVQQKVEGAVNQAQGAVNQAQGSVNQAQQRLTGDVNPPQAGGGVPLSTEGQILGASVIALLIGGTLKGTIDYLMSE